MSDIPVITNSWLWISIGAIPGSCLRLYITRKFTSVFNRPYFGTSFINILASFLLGLFSSLYTNQNHYTFDITYSLCLSIGFTGSLSTFSTFIYEFLIDSPHNSIINRSYFYILVITISILVTILGIHLGDIL